jgi:hypothetical protein
MALGDSISNTYLFSYPERPQVSAGGRRGGSGGGGSVKGPDLSLLDPQENLRYTSGKVEGYYQSLANLRGFAQSMWNTFGIDVTAPDLTNPASIKAHMLYQKGLAHSQMMGNYLSESRKDEEEIRNTALTDENVEARRTGEDNMLEATNYGVEDIVEETNKLAKSYSARGLTDEANQQIQETQTYLIDRLKNAKTQAEADHILANIEALNQAMYDPTKDRDRAARGREASKAVDRTQRPLEISKIRYGGPMSERILLGLKNQGKPVFDEVKWNPMTHRMYMRHADGNEFEIDMNAPSALEDINNLLNEFTDGPNISVDQLFGLDKDLEPIWEGTEQYRLPHITSRPEWSIYKEMRDYEGSLITGINDPATIEKHTQQEIDAARENLSQYAQMRVLKTPKGLPIYDEDGNMLPGRNTDVSMDVVGIEYNDVNTSWMWWANAPEKKDRYIQFKLFSPKFGDEGERFARFYYERSEKDKEQFYHFLDHNYPVIFQQSVEEQLGDGGRDRIYQP